MKSLPNKQLEDLEDAKAEIKHAKEYVDDTATYIENQQKRIEELEIQVLKNERWALSTEGHVTRLEERNQKLKVALQELHSNVEHEYDGSNQVMCEYCDLLDTEAKQ